MSKDDVKVAVVPEDGGEPILIDAGRVIMFMTEEGSETPVPVPLPTIFNQLFGVFKEFDSRLTDLEEKADSRIIKPF